MVSSIAASKSLSLAVYAGMAARAPAAVPVASQVETRGARTEQAAVRQGVTSVVRRVEGSVKLAPAALSALLRVQEKLEVADVRGKAREVLGEVAQRLAEKAEKKTKKPKPHDPPPPPAPNPPPAAVIDDPAPVRFLESVREQLRATPVSQFPDTPFSRRDERPAPAAPAAPAGLGAFYTPGVFTAVQASAMRTTTQAAAGVALLQAAQASLYSRETTSPNPFRISTFA